MNKYMMHKLNETDTAGDNPLFQQQIDPSMFTFPPHMTFKSGRCTKVVKMPPLLSAIGAHDVSWRVTITDCNGEELGGLLRGIGLGFLLVLCCCGIAGIGLCVCICKKVNAKPVGQMAAGSIYAQPVQAVVVTQVSPV